VRVAPDPFGGQELVAARRIEEGEAVAFYREERLPKAQWETRMRCTGVPDWGGLRDHQEEQYATFVSADADWHSWHDRPPWSYLNHARLRANVCAPAREAGWVVWRAARCIRKSEPVRYNYGGGDAVEQLWDEEEQMEE
jgi:hypothetical protein